MTQQKNVSLVIRSEQFPISERKFSIFWGIIGIDTRNVKSHVISTEYS